MSTGNIQTKPNSLIPTWERHDGAPITAANGAPTLSTDGIDCKGYSEAGFSVHTVAGGAAEYKLKPWVYDGVNWVRVPDSTGAAIELVCTVATGDSYRVGMWHRFYLELSAIDAGSLKIDLGVAGPGL